MFLIDLQSKEPLFIQIQSQIRNFIQAGVLKPGDKLPSVRQLARDNGINPNTVARAYAQLEERGYVHNIPKKGVYVAEKGERNEDRNKELMETLQRLKEEGISLRQLLDAASAVYGSGEGKEVRNAEN